MLVLLSYWGSDDWELDLYVQWNAPALVAVPTCAGRVPFFFLPFNNSAPQGGVRGGGVPHHPPTPLKRLGQNFASAPSVLRALCLYCIPCSAVGTSICLLHLESLYYSHDVYVLEVEEP